MSRSSKKDSSSDFAAHHAISRRAALAGAFGAMAAGGMAAGMNLVGCAPAPTSDISSDVMQLRHEWRGEHQPGIATPAQQQLYMAAFDVTTDKRDELIELLTDWSRAAETMMAGEPVDKPTTNTQAVPKDTGEAYDLGPAGLTLTIGFGRTLFEKDGNDRFGIADKVPDCHIEKMRKVGSDFLEEDRCGGDLMIQACAEDPTVAFHAFHMMKFLAAGKATVRWVQSGYAGTKAESYTTTPRNPFGFRDGTQASQVVADDDKMQKNVWIQPEDSGGTLFAGGSYLCLRRTHLMMEAWDRLQLWHQEAVFGRDKLKGAPLSGGEEFDDEDFSAVDDKGNPLIPKSSHQWSVAEEHNDGNTMLRRSYSYMEGIDSNGMVQAGLAFIGFARDPERNFVSIMENMNGTELLEYLKFTGSAVFLCPPGMQEGDLYIGQRLFEA